YLNVYTNQKLVYLSGTIKGYLTTRHQQQQQIHENGLAVYSPGNHITFGDPVAEKYPELVAEIDLKILKRCDAIIFDLGNLSAGTCAEIGYAVGAKYYHTKKLLYFNLDTPNFFINGLAEFMHKTKDLQEAIN